YAAATLAALRDHGATDIQVYSPSGRAAKFATKHGIRSVAAGAYAAAAAGADLIVTCTSAESPVLSAETLLSGALAIGRDAASTHRSLIIDLGLPRNVDPDVSNIAGIALLDLETIRLHAPLEELHATDAAREVVSEAARRFAVVGERQSITPAVVALREHAFGLLEAEIARVNARGDDDGRTEQALRHLVGVLLHTPTVRAHELADAGRADDYVDALGALFGIEVAEQEADDAGTERAAG
ncbi:MAG TPA: glutamyl-tRNA reductase, partial [Microbacterium sp.]|nr:glutamyl-tRNA reductase [Microbacterium sp.]